MSAGSVQVVIRAQALTKKGINADQPVLWNIKGNTIEPVDKSVPQSQNPMVFDRVFGAGSTNKEVYEATVAPLVTSCLEGYNCTIFSYGSTSSGKVQTMKGSSDDAGIIPRVIDQIFRIAGKVPNNLRYVIRMAYFKIHNDRVYDLLKFQNYDVKIVDYVDGGIMICAREVVTSVKDQVFDLLKLGNRNCQMYSRKMKIKDSQTDTILRIIIEHEVPDGTKSLFQIAHLNLVTLAGSERVACSKGLLKFVDRDYVNRSSSILASIITQKVQKAPVNYRQSKLTALLKHSIGGNAKIALIADISLASLENTYFTLCFALQVRRLRNKPIMNIVRTTRCVLSQCLSQIQQLEEQLQDIKKPCADLDVAVRRMPAIQMTNVLHERINLISKAFVRSKDITEQEFPNLLIKSSRLSLSLLETQLLNVVRANTTYNTEFVGVKWSKLPFELLFVRLSMEIGNEFISHFREEDQEELVVTDYLIDSDTCEWDLEFSEKDDSDTAESMKISFEYSDLEKSILTQITNKELRTDFKNLREIFTANYVQQFTSLKEMEKENQMLFDEITELTKLLGLEDIENENLQTKLRELEREINSQEKQESNDFKKQYEQLLKEENEKDMEYSILLRQKEVLEEKVNVLTSNLRRPRATLEQAEVSKTDMLMLQSEISTLKQKVVDQKLIIHDMETIHKRREHELLKQLNEKGIQKERIFSDIMKTDKQMQMASQLLETQERAPSSIASEESLASSWVQCPETLGNLPEEMLAVTTTEDQKHMEDGSLLSSRLSSGVELEQFEMAEEMVFDLLSDKPVEDIEDQFSKNIHTGILRIAKRVFDTCQDKYNLVCQIQAKELTTDFATQDTASTLAEIMDFEIENVGIFIDKAQKSSIAVCALLRDIQIFRAVKHQDYKDIPGQLAKEEKLPISGVHSQTKAKSGYSLPGMSGPSTSTSVDALTIEKELDWIRNRVKDLSTKYGQAKDKISSLKHQSGKQ